MRIDELDINQVYIQAIEELAELQQALAKILRSGTANASVMTKEQMYQNANEELADVENVLSVLKRSPWYDEVMNHEIRDAKFKRWADRIKGEKK